MGNGIGGAALTNASNCESSNSNKIRLTIPNMNPTSVGLNLYANR